jgi:predicted enzyme related to lactoylglutathione lyase
VQGFYKYTRAAAAPDPFERGRCREFERPPMPPSANFAFTKLIVHDLEKMAAFYGEVYGLHAVRRVSGERIGDEEIDEIMMSADPDAAWSSLVLLEYVGRTASPNGGVILGFTTDDLPALLERVQAAGGRVHAPMKEMPELGIRVAFATDPEGHLAELVQVLA